MRRKKYFKMLLILTIYIDIFLISYSFGLDPDVDICDNFLLDGAVYADDGYTYIFKGLYYWQTNHLYNKPGIVSTGKKLSEHWPELSEPITASFAITNRNGNRITIFLIKDRWYSYQNNRLMLSGSTSGWSRFPHSRVTTAFAANHETSMVYFLYDKSEKYILYNLIDMTKPSFVRMGATTVGSNYVWFLETSRHESTHVITDLMDVNAVITFDNLLVFLSRTRYCFVDLTQKTDQKRCAPKDYTNSNLFQCPIVKQNTLPQQPTQQPNQSKNSKKQATKSITEPANEAQNTGEPSKQSMFPLVIVAILIAIIVAIIVIGGIIGYFIKRRSRSYKKDITEKEKSTTTDYSIMTIDSRYGNVVSQTYNKPKVKNKAKK